MKSNDAEYQLLVQNEILRRKAQTNILAFTKYTKRNYDINWHHIRIAQKIMAWIRGDINRLMVFMPPRRGKTELANVRLVAFLVGLMPELETISCSYSASLASKVSSDIQRVIESPFYQDIFPDIRLPTMADKLAKRTINSFDVIDGGNVKGSYRATGVGGGISGMGFDRGIIDDPYKNREESMSEVNRAKVLDWYNSTFRTRMSPNAGILIIQTRWHEYGLAGSLLDLSKTDDNADKWEVISFPEIKDIEDDNDPRDIGEVLWPERYSLEEALKTKATVGSYVWEALYQQRPTAVRGNVIKRNSIKYYDSRPTRFDFLVHSWDFTFKKTDTSDYVVGMVWGAIGPDYYLIYMSRDRMGFSDSLKAIENMINMYPQYYAVLVEEKANGAAIIEMIQQRFSKVIPIIPKESKEARLEAVSPLFEAGNVHLPRPDGSNDTELIVNELCSFPTGKNDDIVDSTSQALSYLESKKGYDITKLTQM